MNTPFQAGRREGRADGRGVNPVYAPAQNPYLAARNIPLPGRSEVARAWADGYVAGWQESLDATEAAR